MGASGIAMFHSTARGNQLSLSRGGEFHETENRASINQISRRVVLTPRGSHQPDFPDTLEDNIRGIRFSGDYAEEIKAKVRERLQRGATPGELEKEFKIPRQTIRKWR